jgi:PAS domain S-box-containing protein
LEHLDLASVIKVSQAVSGEIVFEKLIDTVMRTAIEHAGAERGVLILKRGTELRVEAEAVASGDTVVVRLREESPASAAFPESIVQYVIRTGETVILDDAAGRNQFWGDEYLCQRRARSILCLPMMKQATLTGVLYLENTLAPHVFTSSRLGVLRLLASQAAISLENTRLYRDLTEREAKIRRLVDANIIGIFMWKFHGQILEANDAFLRMIGYEREDLISGRLRWTELVPPEWLELDERKSGPGHKMTGRLEPFEKELLQKDGSRLPVLIGAVTHEEAGKEGIAFVLDLSEQKRAEAEARESEARYRQVQMELAHANRLATMGQLTASIAHEVKQPIATARNNATAALRFLSRNPPDLQEVREAVGCVVNDSDRAALIIDRIRAQVTKIPARSARFDINDAINELIALTRRELVKNGVAVRVCFSEQLPPVEGDRVQLQQVVLNLILNAIEAMSSVDDVPREVSISTERRRADEILVAVRDSGPGIDPEHLERVFDSFYTTKPGGMGLGLSICRSIVRAHGGRLWAEANAPTGAVFQFSLAVVKVDS